MAVIKDTEGFLEKDEILKILNAKEDNSITSWDQIPSPFLFKDMKKAVDLYKDALSTNTKIKMVHDSDADGLGTYLESWFFYSEFYYKNIEFVIVDRKEGYGLLPKHIEDNCLIITSDNGITANEACTFAKTKVNCKIIITDHHQVDSHFGPPDADAIINPWVPGETFPFKEINGTFVYWFFLKAIQEDLQFNFNMWTFLPELTLTTISDVMPLIHINRFIVKQGLAHMPHSDRRWVKTFLHTHSLDEVLAEDLAFKIIPSINVTNRLTRADESALFLIQEDHILSTQWFGYINNLNNQRKKMQETLFKTIELKYKQWLDQPFIIIPGNEADGFHKGILGPTAGRLVEKYKKPALVLCNHNGVLSGSGRSIGNVDILSIVKSNEFVNQNKTGGHKVACGVSVSMASLNQFWSHCQNEVSKLPPELFEGSSYVMGKLNIRDIDLDLYYDIKKFEPFGEKFQRPTFLIRGKAKDVKKLGKDGTHISFHLEDGLGGRIKCLFFFASDPIKANENYSLVCTIQHDSFNNSDNVCLFVKSVAGFKDFQE
jgi:single-stranded-DNA-specific exonuclease